MRVDSEWYLSICEGRWIAKENNITVSGITLEELEDNIKDSLRKSNRYEKQQIVTVFLGFDTKTLPEWIRPYHAHYFNRYLRFKL